VNTRDTVRTTLTVLAVLAAIAFLIWLLVGVLIVGDAIANRP
jgi:preprotein translocase subunit SecE